MTTRPLHHLVPSLLALTGLAAAETTPPESSGATLVVVGDQQADAARLPGTATVLDSQLLEQHRYQNVQQTLRMAPGVNAVDEDGYGRRLNVGLRGGRSVRSLKTLILEDGIPLAPNPYNDPGLYMGPAYERYASVEVVKGSGQILYGPHTVAGLVNFKTRDPGEEQGGKLDVAVDSFGGVRGLVGVDVPLGESVMLTGDLYALDTDGFRRYDHVTLTDLAPRLLWTVSPEHSLEFRASHTAEQSNLTYQGLSEQDFEDDAYNRYQFTSRDSFDGERTALAVRHRWDLAAAGSLLNTVYYQLTDRVWDRAEYAYDATNQTYTGRTVTTAGVTRDASARDRSYYHGGVESRWNHDFALGSVPTTVDAGARIHVEGQENATRDHEVVSGDYLTRQVDERDTLALAGWAQASFAVGAGVTVIPGVRVEALTIDSERTINNYAETSGLAGDSSTSEVLPGLGLTWQALQAVQLYGGVHRGFSPPSYSQAVSSTGEDNELDSELSWNYEVGVRWTHGEVGYADAAFFYVDYENIIAQGIAGGPQINGGEALHSGAEFLTEWDLLGLTNGGSSDGIRVPARLALTVLSAEYQSDVYSGSTLVAEDGNTIEYAPELGFSLSLGVQDFGPRKSFGITLTGTYIGEQFADGLNTEEVSADGSVGELDSVFLLDLATRYAPEGASYEVYFTIENALDEEYAAYRRGGQGTVAGAPLKASLGVAAEF